MSFRCLQCTFKTNRLANLKTHNLVHISNKPFVCSSCSYKSKRKSDLKRHEWIHSNKKPFACQCCSFSTATRSALTIHIRFRHTGESPFMCSYMNCKWRGKRLLDLKTHIRTRHTHEKPFRCNECYYQSSNYSSLTLHKRQYHLFTFPFKCSHCSFRTASSHTLKIHKQSLHEGKKPFICSNCHSSFTSKGALRHHELNHEKQKYYPHECPLVEYGEMMFEKGKGHIPCSIRCKTRLDLEYHILRNHTASSSSVQEKFHTEDRLGAFLQSKNILFDRDWSNRIVLRDCNNNQVEGNKHSIRLDYFLLDFSIYLKAIVIVENDEFAHRRTKCDFQRLFNLVNAIEKNPHFRGLPIIFIRLNPHTYWKDNVFYNPPLQESHDKLWHVLQSLEPMEFKNKSGVYLIYIHYDTQGGKLKVFQKDFADDFSVLYEDCLLLSL